LLKIDYTRSPTGGNENSVVCGTPDPTAWGSGSHDLGEEQDHEGNPSMMLGVYTALLADTEF
jgi:hypothetical protein